LIRNESVHGLGTGWQGAVGGLGAKPMYKLYADLSTTKKILEDTVNLVPCKKQQFELFLAWYKAKDKTWMESETGKSFRPAPRLLPKGVSSYKHTRAGRRARKGLSRSCRPPSSYGVSCAQSC
jgi:hypothetical protein